MLAVYQQEGKTENLHHINNSMLICWGFLHTLVHTICMTVSFITAEAKWVAQVFVFSEAIPLTPECLWYNELVSNLNFQVTDGYKYKDLEQICIHSVSYFLCLGLKRFMSSDVMLLFGMFLTFSY